MIKKIILVFLVLYSSASFAQISGLDSAVDRAADCINSEYQYAEYVYWLSYGYTIFFSGKALTLAKSLDEMELGGNPELQKLIIKTNTLVDLLLALNDTFSKIRLEQFSPQHDLPSDIDRLKLFFIESKAEELKGTIVEFKATFKKLKAFIKKDELKDQSPIIEYLSKIKDCSLELDGLLSKKN